MSDQERTEQLSARYQTAVEQAEANGIGALKATQVLRSAQYSALLEQVARLTVMATLGHLEDDEALRDEYRRTIETRIDNRALEIAIADLGARA